jgi:2-polyprenyl-6-methoxyphenol hydroxylase-like FAD-dependent oxidoreductase
MRAVVVGAGIGGLATAIALDRAGVEPIVIERAPELHDAGFGLVLSANAVTALSRASNSPRKPAQHTARRFPFPALNAEHRPIPNRPAASSSGAFNAVQN